MTDERTKETIDFRGEQVEVWRYPNGSARRTDNGHYLIPPQDSVIRTPERAKELHRLGKQKALRSKLKGMIRGAGLDVDANAVDEELIDKAGDALEVFLAHMGQTFLKTSNIRGMGEVWPKLTEYFHVEEKEEQEKSAEPTLEDALKGLIGAIQQAVERQGEVIDGEARDINVLTDTHPKP